MLKLGIGKPTNIELDRIIDDAGDAISAESLYRGLTPLLEAQIEAVLRDLFNAPAELGALLDARAKIQTAWSMLSNLRTASARGASARDAIKDVFPMLKQSEGGNGKLDSDLT